MGKASDFFKKAGKWFKEEVINPVESAVGVVYKDGKSAVSWFGKEYDKVLTAGTGLVDKGGDALKDVSGGIADAIPTIALVAGVLGVAYIVTTSGSRSASFRGAAMSIEPSYTYSGNKKRGYNTMSAPRLTYGEDTAPNRECFCKKIKIIH